MQLSGRGDYVIVGAGVQRLSTAWQLTKELKARGRGAGEGVLVLDNTRVAAGPSGIG